MKKGILFMALAVVVIVSIAIVSCASPTPTPSLTPSPSQTPTSKPEPKELPIGFLSPLSGPVAFAGETYLNSTTLAAEAINTAGGVTVAGQAYKIKLISYDTKNNAEDARSSAERLIFQDKVKYIIGGISSDSLGFQPVTEQNKMIILPCGGGIKPSPKNPYTFKTTAEVDIKYVGVYKYLKENMPTLKTVAFVNPDSPVGDQYDKMSRTAAESYGFTVVETQRISSGASDFSPQLSKLLTSKPDIIDLGATGGGSDSALVIKQARTLGFTGQMVCAVGLTSKTVLEVAGPLGMEGIMETGFSIDDPALNPVFKAFVKTYTDR